METEHADSATIEDLLSQLRDEVARLNSRVAALEARVGGQPAGADPGPSAAISGETVLAISAAVAAYLGVKPHIRQIRLLSSHSWAQQGRATIQASHELPPIIHH